MVPPPNQDATPVIDTELVNDFRDEFHDAFEQVQAILVELEYAEDKHDQLHALFRVLHSIKSNLRMMQLNALSEFIHALENILDDMREDRIEYDNQFSDATLLSLEKVEVTFEAIFAGDHSAFDKLLPLQALLEKVHEDLANFSNHLRNVLRHLDPGLLDEVSSDNDEQATDLTFFISLANFMEQRLNYEQGVAQRQLTMAEQLNAIAGNPIEQDQLRAAIYVHDVGMIFLPQSLLKKEGIYTEEERHSLAIHPELGAQLLEQLTIWSAASEIVLQHHERVDGQGYPNQLQGDQICDGAKLLSIVDTFEAMTHTRAHREHRRTVLRVVAEINA